jgi:hypothetical protein
VRQFGEKEKGNPKNQESAEAINQRRQQLAEQVSVVQPHDEG